PGERCAPHSAPLLSLPDPVFATFQDRARTSPRWGEVGSSASAVDPGEGALLSGVLSLTTRINRLVLKRRTPSPARFARDLSPPGRGERLVLRIYLSPTRSLLPFRIGHSPLPGGERSDRVRQQSIRVRGRSRGGRT